MRPNVPRYYARHYARGGPSLGPGQAKGEFCRVLIRERRNEVRKLVYGPDQIVKTAV
jgi:hypothetical protein